MTSAVVEEEGDVLAWQVHIPSSLELTLCRDLPIEKEAAIRAFIDYAEYLQESKPLEPGNGILELIHWAFLLATFNEAEHQSLAQVVEVAYNSAFWGLAGKAVEYFGAKCVDLVDAAQARSLSTAFSEITC